MRALRWDHACGGKHSKNFKPLRNGDSSDVLVLIKLYVRFSKGNILFSSCTSIKWKPALWQHSYFVKVLHQNMLSQISLDTPSCLSPKAHRVGCCLRAVISCCYTNVEVKPECITFQGRRYCFCTFLFRTVSLFLLVLSWYALDLFCLLEGQRGWGQLDISSLVCSSLDLVAVLTGQCSWGSTACPSQFF